MPMRLMFVLAYALHCWLADAMPVILSWHAAAGAVGIAAVGVWGVFHIAMAVASVSFAHLCTALRPSSAGSAPSHGYRK